MIVKEVVGNELYVWMNGSLLYKRWIDLGYGKVICRQPFTAKDTESFINKTTSNDTQTISVTQKRR